MRLCSDDAGEEVPPSYWLMLFGYVCFSSVLDFSYQLHFSGPVKTQLAHPPSFSHRSPCLAWNLPRKPGLTPLSPPRLWMSTAPTPVVCECGCVVTPIAYPRKKFVLVSKGFPSVSLGWGRCFVGGYLLPSALCIGYSAASQPCAFRHRAATLGSVSSLYKGLYDCPNRNKGDTLWVSPTLPPDHQEGPEMLFSRTASCKNVKAESQFVFHKTYDYVYIGRQDCFGACGVHTYMYVSGCPYKEISSLGCRRPPPGRSPFVVICHCLHQASWPTSF